ncbi:CLUMA_CG011844, isoform A [Clunio marinus]|uniref:CLUMA_CG011844, isoform A n=1 Tax=Clunio marinus TaxID=568069 RepID=A0A1J1IDY9_9DIPT|nr:CLUMA_CG011844, isoform A [Clunio marinus]
MLAAKTRLVFDASRVDKIIQSFLSTLKKLIESMSDLTVTPDEVPEWLTSDFFRDTLSLTESFIIRKIKYACERGENFASKIYRVVLSFPNNDKSYIVKSRPIGNGFAEEFTKKFCIFPKEIEMYTHVDKFENIFHEIGFDIGFAPKCIGVKYTPTDILIIEDMNAKGFKTARKSDGLKQPEMEFVLKKLAQFHAASAVHCERNGSFDEKFSRGIYNSDMKEIFDQSYDFNISLIINEFFSKWPTLDKRIIEKMKNWRDFTLDELIRTMKPKPDEFSCLNHGDMWISNILFQYDSNGNVKDCQFIDFQQCVFTSPAIDLLNLIFTSAETETKLQNFEGFVKIYHGHLVDALKVLGYNKTIPTLKWLYLDILDRAFLAVWNSIATLPMCLAENIKESSSDNLLGENEEGKNFKEKIYNNERYRKHLTELLNYFDNRGLVDLC